MKLKVITLLIFGLIITGTTLSQNIPNDIPKAFKTGDVQCLEKYMEDKILLIISGIKQQLPRPKAKEKLSAFFSKNKPTDFKTIHQSEQNNPRDNDTKMKRRDTIISQNRLPAIGTCKT